MIPRVTSGAGIDGSESATHRVNRDTLSFDPGVAEFAHKWIAWPAGYSHSRAQFAWESQSGGTIGQQVRLRVTMRCFADSDALDQPLGTAQGVSDALDAVGDLMITGWTPNITPAGTPAAGVRTLVEISRDPAHADDNLSVDMLLHDVVLEFL